MYQKLLSSLLAALLAVSPLIAEETATEAATPQVATMVLGDTPAQVEVTEAELVEMFGYMTALNGGVSTLEIDEAGIVELVSGLKKSLSGELNLATLPRPEVEAALGEAQARAEAVQAGAEELPSFSEGSLEKIGVFVAMQSGFEQRGFGADDADLLGKGFIAGASATEPDPSFEAKMPAFQEFMQARMEIAQAEMMNAQAEVQKAAMAEFEDTAAEWKVKENFNVVLETTQGNVTIELMPSIAPLAVANFVGHIESGYYNDLVFHRIIKDFMIQGGDPLGTGTGGESIWGKNFPDEVSSEVGFDTEGLLAMANSGPMTNGSQFFITTSKPEWLNGKHTIFGKVVEGYDNVKKLEGVETGAQDKPVEEQKIIKAYVAE